MVFKVNKSFLFIILILLQSCSGGKIGNFLESSFKNDGELKIKEDTKNILRNKKVIKSDSNYEKNKNVGELKIKEDTKNILRNKKVIKSDSNYEKNKNDGELKIKEDTKSILRNKKVIKSDPNYEKNKNVGELKIKEDTKNILRNKKVIKSDSNYEKNKKITQKNISRKKGKYQPQTYKIIFILKDVDPKDPIEELSTILRNSDVNFEIEKIERFIETKNKSIKMN